jgi:hypothetical protein
MISIVLLIVRACITCIYLGIENINQKPRTEICQETITSKVHWFILDSLCTDKERRGVYAGVLICIWQSCTYT